MALALPNRIWLSVYKVSWRMTMSRVQYGAYYIVHERVRPHLRIRREFRFLYFTPRYYIRIKIRCVSVKFENDLHSASNKQQLRPIHLQREKKT